MNPLTVIVAGIAVMLAMMFGLWNRVGQLERRIAKDNSDEAIDQICLAAVNSERRFLEKLTNEKALLPQTNTWAITERTWEKAVLAKAETLRHLIAQDHTDHPDGHTVERQIDEIELNFNLALGLVQVANLEKDITINQVEQRIRRIILLADMKKSEPNLSENSYLYEEIEELARAQKLLRVKMRREKDDVWKEFCKQLDQSR